MKSFLMTVTALCSLGACNRPDPMEANLDNALTNVAANDAVPVAGIVVFTFIKEAIQGDNAEIALGELAQSQGDSQKVKDFGKMLAQDHSAHKQELASFAESAAVPVTDDLTTKGKTDLEKLKTLSGAEFDKQFKAMMIDHHTAEIARYEARATSSDAELAALAKKTLPVLRRHLEAAKAL